MWSTVSHWAASTAADAPLAPAIAYDAMQDLIELFRHMRGATAKVFDPQLAHDAVRKRVRRACIRVHVHG
jgi:hypothetical protein